MTFKEAVATLGEQKVAELVTWALGKKAYQAKQHKAYNERKNEMVREYKRLMEEKRTPLERLTNSL